MSSAIASADAHRVADALGRALQLTNILRDLDEDAQRGRLYLPRELLDRHGIRTDEPAAVLRHPALPAVCRDLAAVAEGHFAEARRAMALCSRRAMRPAAVMGAFYHAMLKALLQAAVARSERAGSACRSRRNCGWCCATGSCERPAGCMSSAPVSPGSPPRSR